MNIPFFKEFLMISDPITIGILIIFIGLLVFLYFLQRKQYDFGKTVIIATILGAVFGFAIQILAGFPDDPMKIDFIKESTKWFSLIGGGFIDLIRMLIIPIVFVSVVNVILNMDKTANLRKLARHTVVVPLVMVAIAAVVGLILGTVTGLGQGFSMIDGASKMREVKPIVDTFRQLIPNNPILAMANTNVIGVVIFAVVFAVVARMVKQSNTNALPTLHSLFGELQVIVNWMADFIIGLMPYGVLALLASTLAQKGMGAVLDMGLFVVLIYVGVVIMLIAQAILLTIAGINPVMYFKKAKAPLLLAFTSRSSMGVLPLTVDTLTQKMGVNSTTANAVASFGTTAGMQGCAGIFPALCIVYIANVSGIPLDISLYVISVVVIAIGSIGIAGVPGTATMAASVSLSGTGLGAYFSSISPVLAIDPIIDMGRTMLNVSGSMTNAIFVDHLLGTFDKDVYDNPQADI